MLSPAIAIIALAEVNVAVVEERTNEEAVYLLEISTNAVEPELRAYNLFLVQANSMVVPPNELLHTLTGFNNWILPSNAAILEALLSWVNREYPLDRFMVLA